jgi:ketosteroid isomerase-like protein
MRGFALHRRFGGAETARRAGMIRRAALPEWAVNTRGEDPPMNPETVQELIRREEEWSQAIVRNDAEAIGQYMADDWVIVGPDGRMSDKKSFLGLVRSGDLTHDVMEGDEIKVRVWDNAAVVSARGVSGGTFRGQSFRAVERVSDVWIKQGEWRCVLTHLSRMDSK